MGILKGVEKNNEVQSGGVQIVRAILDKIKKNDVYENGFSLDKITIEKIWDKW